MTNNDINFSKRVIQLNEGDSLFFDTNVLIDYLNEKSKNHEAIKHFIIHTVNQDCQRFISQTALQELLYIVAKELFITEQLLSCNYKEKYEASSAWIELPKGRIPSNLKLLKDYNEKALTSINELFPLFKVTKSIAAEAKQALQISFEYPLHSADAFIMSSAVQNNSALVSLDGDMRTTSNEIPIYYCSKSKFNPSIYDSIEGHNQLYDEIFNAEN
ncbi:type II toxin-antitoxin system VapC family toxin [Lysinibacillus sp. NPDC056185]|uniref:type II toxin-antitoxin system VapC family toxin n=1 Tax=Lysinibacillus sp. NPDC056185 TaxID=3345739 RepID=UPI0039EF7AA5